jgi:AcrR family transcriptional regulator
MDKPFDLLGGRDHSGNELVYFELVSTEYSRAKIACKDVVDLAFHNRHAVGVPRPRAFDEDEVVAAAKELFWQQGYVATSIGDLEEATGLGRSSLYMAFGTKRELFEAAIRAHLATFVDPLLDPLERDGAGLEEIVGYFKLLATRFTRPEAQRGCLMINTIGECAGRDPDFTREGQEFLERVRAAFANALKSSVKAGVMTRLHATQRAASLAGASAGAWITVRADPAAARAVCLSTAAQVALWVPA